MDTIIVTAAYIATQMLSDISSLKIVTLFGFSMDAGTLVYPLTFTLRDLVHKTVGIKGARIVIVCAAVVNLAMAFLFWIVARLPGDPAVGPQLEFSVVLSPVWRIVIASILAEVIAEMLDTEIYHLWVTRITKRYQWMRVLVSNAVSIPIDSLIFVWGAFSGIYAPSVIWSIFIANLILKGIVTLIGLPLIYVVKERKTK
jgi:hypothetical protein